MKYIYLDTPRAAIALNLKAGSSSLCRAIISAYHPQVETYITRSHGGGNGVAYPKGKSADNTRWLSLCPKVDPSERPVVLLAVRHPIDRFRSSCAESQIEDIDAKITELENNSNRDPRFWPQSRLVYRTTKLFAFPDHLDELATEAGISLPLPDIDRGLDRPKPELNPEQLARLQAVYAEDIALYESITEAGQIHKAHESVADPLQATLEAFEREFSLLPPGEKIFWEPVQVKVGEYLTSGDIQSAKTLLETLPSLYTGMVKTKKIFLDLF